MDQCSVFLVLHRPRAVAFGFLIIAKACISVSQLSFSSVFILVPVDLADFILSLAMHYQQCLLNPIQNFYIFKLGVFFSPEYLYAILHEAAGSLNFIVNFKIVTY